MLADEVCQGSLGRVVAVGQRQAILQVVEGQHDHGEPFLSGFKRLQTEIAKSQGIFQVSVINLHWSALLVISQDLLHRQG